MAVEQKHKPLKKLPWGGSPLGDPAEAAKRRAALLERSFARRADRAPTPTPKVETLPEFGERVFGNPEGRAVLLDWMRENAPWLLDDDGEDATDPVNGR